MMKPNVSFHAKPWSSGCPKCGRYCLARKSNAGQWVCAGCGHRQDEEPGKSPTNPRIGPENT